MNISEALWWTFLNLLTIVFLAFYSMEEMACVSFNRLRLHYYVSQGKKRALWLNYLLQEPTRLFTTTLLSVNAAMFIGSECARQTYLALGLNPDWAPVTQVMLVVIFGELAPMFAARRYAEHVAILGAPLLFGTAYLMQPILWCMRLVAKLFEPLMGKDAAHPHIVLNQEELQKILAMQDEEASESELEDLNIVSRNLFSLRHKEARDVMQPLEAFPLLPSNATIKMMRTVLSQHHSDYVLIYQRDPSYIVGIAPVRELLRVPDARRVRDYSSSPWFITQQTKLIQVVKELRRHEREIALVLKEQGLAVGVLTLQDLGDELFGKAETEEVDVQETPTFMLDRIFPGEMQIAVFNRQFEVPLNADPNLTLARLMTETLGHHPEVGESIYIAPYELTVEEATLLEIKKVLVSTQWH